MVCAEAAERPPIAANTAPAATATRDRFCVFMDALLPGLLSRSRLQFSVKTKQLGTVGACLAACLRAGRHRTLGSVPVVREIATLVNVHIHEFQHGGAVLDAAALAQFQQQMGDLPEIDRR